MDTTKPASTFIISDTHWYHDEMITAIDRPKDYAKLIFKRWASTVTENDIVIHLGDVIWDNQLKLKEILDSLPGRKILVKGNHDKRSDNWYMANGFSFSCDSLIYKNILFSHVPMVLPEGVDWNIFGHWHNFPQKDWEPVLKARLTDKHKLFSLEDMNYMPVKLERFLELKTRDVLNTNTLEVNDLVVEDKEKPTKTKARGFELEL